MAKLTLSEWLGRAEKNRRFMENVRAIRRIPARPGIFAEYPAWVHPSLRKVLEGGAFQDIDEAEALTSSHTHELAGVLRLQMPPVLATYVVGPLVAGFRERYPKIRIDVEVNSMPEPLYP